MRVYHLLHIIFLSALCLLCGCKADEHAPQRKTTKIERNSIKDGNKAFREGNFRKALDYYNDALASCPSSDPASFNKAVALMKLSGGRDSSMIKEATDIYNTLGETASDLSIKEKANYNLGNISFYADDFDRSIEFYKRALRINPNNMKTRENLRVAQLKRRKDDQQQNQNQQQQQDQQQQDQQQQQQQQQQQDADADQILQSMQNRENQTRQQAKKKESNTQRSYSDKPW